MAAEADTVSEPVDTGFSATKKRILETLKRHGDRSLTDLAADLQISKMAVLKHLAVLEDKGLVERSFRAEGRGRPRAHFCLSSKATRLFPEAYTHLTMCALEYIDEKLGREAVVQLLRQRTQEVYRQNGARFEGRPFSARVQALVDLREEGGYMAERGRIGKNSAEVLERNCPILAVAQKYGEACQVEVDLFQKLLHAEVEASHRVVAGDSVCRFLIRRRSEYHG
jgi:DeoR family suf operon transcriptional repressor